ncbi:MAG: hypothetical protein J6D34_04000 [Atopobiaceae bacterium]|nr:hypothetical protein [Atopobiaceae bacterium]
MTREDELFDQRIHDAYERVEMSDEAQERMLANLLAAREVAETPVRTADTQVDAVPRRRLDWRVLMPIAAVLLVGLVVVRLAGVAGKQSENHALMAPSSTTEYEVEATKDEAVVASDADVPLTDSDSEASRMDGVAGEEAESSLQGFDPDLYHLVTLEDGLVLTTHVDGSGASEVPEEQVGELVGVATVTSPEAPTMTLCKVYRLLNDSSGYALRYGGEQVYWYCVPA